jgi:hypothetical protein
MMAHLRAALILCTIAILLVVGTPGLDHLGTRFSSRRARLLEKHFGPVIATGTQKLVGFNAKIRIPITRKVGVFQPVFRVRQSWNLYRDGPRRVYRLEVRVDGNPVFRSGSSELDWLAPQLGNRRMRPVVESTTKKFKSANWRGLSRFVIAQARAAWPEAKSVELVALSGRRPGKRLRPTHRISSSAPDWGLEKTK